MRALPIISNTWEALPIISNTWELTDSLLAGKQGVVVWRPTGQHIRVWLSGTQQHGLGKTPQMQWPVKGSC